MTLYTHRIYAFIPITNKDTANSYGAQLDHDTGGALTFSKIRLSPSGAEPATHCGLNSPAMDDVYSQLPTLAAALSGTYYSVSVLSGQLEATSSITAVVGEEWNWSKSLLDAELKVIVPLRPTW